MWWSLRALEEELEAACNLREREDRYKAYRNLIAYDVSKIDEPEQS